MQLLLGVALLTFVLATSVVGVRLLALARRSRQLPELLIGAGFTLVGLLGYPLAMASGFGRGTVAEVQLGLWLAGILLMHAGLACLWVFTARVFRPERAWALAFAALLVALGLASAFGSLTALLAAPGDALSYRVAPRWTALGQLSSGGGFAWIGVEAWLQLGMARRRQALGLADPVVANRFLLWMLFSASTLGMNLANSCALVAGVSSVESAPVQAAMALLGLCASACMYLAFLPPAAYRRWLERAHRRPA
jgi:hypothetical protein